MVVVHPGEIILPELGPELGRYAQERLATRDIDILTNLKVATATPDGVTLTDGRYIPCKTLIWTAGTSAHPIIGKLPCDCERGRVKVNEFLEVPRWPNVWAVGDAAVVPDLRTGKSHPPTAQHAMREGRVAADNIVAAITGAKKKAFDFVTIGQLAAIGHRTGVAKIFGFKFSGFLAWWLWRTIYLSKLPSFDRKLRVAINWTLDLLFPKDLVQFMGVRTAAVSHTDHDDEHGHSSAESRTSVESYTSAESQTTHRQPALNVA
jgi:NADH dehydrogenase